MELPTSVFRPTIGMLSLLSPVAGLTCARAYAGLFVLWVFQSAALEAFSWREVRAALHCASDLFHRQW
eukprot:s1633_g2.t1